MRCFHILFCAVGVFAFIPASDADAAHDCRRAIHETFDANYHQLNAQFESQKRALHHEHRANRECVHREIRHAERVLCGEERAAVVRDLHYKLRKIDRRHHHRIRALHHNEMHCAASATTH